MLKPFQQFARTGGFSGILLLIATLAALVWANSSWHTYFTIWEERIAVNLAGYLVDLPLLAWLNDGLMAAFFLLVGLEIKRELLVGELASIRQAALPTAAARRAPAPGSTPPSSRSTRAP